MALRGYGHAGLGAHLDKNDFGRRAGAQQWSGMTAIHEQSNVTGGFEA